MKNNDNACACDPCPGTECACGCQDVRAEGKSECACGASCKCGSECACEKK